MGMHVEERAREAARHVEQVELTIARLLRIGTGLASLLLAAGLAVLLLGLPISIGPDLITAGLVVLVCTPLLRVASAFLIYLRLGDRVYAAISLLVLILVFAGILLGLADHA